MHQYAADRKVQPLHRTHRPACAGKPNPRQEAQYRKRKTQGQKLEWRRVRHGVAGDDESGAPDQHEYDRHRTHQRLIARHQTHLTRARISGTAFCR